MEKPKFPNSVRKHIRRQKATLRRLHANEAERAEALAKVYATFGYVQESGAQKDAEEKGAKQG